jgi:ACR3 family arsenite transporter
MNWLVKPFSMALIAWAFFRVLFSPWSACSSRCP